MKKAFILVVAIIVIGVGAWIIYENKINFNDSQKQNATSTLISQVSYLCDEEKTINASYYEGPSAAQPQPDEMPTPTGSVDLVLSDGRSLTLPQAISASGTRYANSDESFIFLSKGSDAFILENNVQTYAGCVDLTADTGELP